jgi:hypothetical protein
MDVIQPLQMVGLLLCLYGERPSLISRCNARTERYFGSIRAPGLVYDHVLEFLEWNHGRKIREVMGAEIDILDVIPIVRRGIGSTWQNF